MRVGPIVSSDLFYNPDEGQYERWSKRGVLAVEMEAAALFTVGAIRGVQSGCLLTVSDIIVGGEFKRISDDDLQAAVDRMTRVALAVTADSLAEPSSWSTPRRTTARPASAGPRSRTAPPAAASRATPSSPSGPASSASWRVRSRSKERRCSSSSAATARSTRSSNGLAGREDVELAVIPRGTGWDFVRTYGIPHSSTARSTSR